MSYRTYDYRCDKCEHVTVELVDRNDTPPAMDCSECGAVQSRHSIISAPMVLNHSYPDGTKRFGVLREQRKLDRAKAEARRDGNREAEKAIDKQKKKLQE